MKQETFYKFGFTFKAPSKKKFKKYDVYHDDVYITSFGQLKKDETPFTQYNDRIGYYQAYNNNNEKKRENYRKRHKNDHINDISSSGFWSWFMLW